MTRMVKDCHRPRLQVLHVEVTNARRCSPAAAVLGLNGRGPKKRCAEVAASPPREISMVCHRAKSHVDPSAK